ncbi:hypothetical protein NEHOM01_0199 [Nematocida homosporus]|uniref:uncharacterized protein n=1 Tax=Nematocida homosporus TaxID=1912981 RepID=UPI002220E0D4|nr:uncharacterized protein NEHOM01_0199 [Nematocida homosporus]KAI5184524.1 hypothetical protein NEHOM01_0199 [Nematocida homosporus]
MLVYDIVIVGKNISALTAAIYSGMARKSTLHITCPSEEMNTSGVNRYLGYKEGSYATFQATTERQLEKFKVSSLEEDLQEVQVNGDRAIVKTETQAICAKTVIISTKQHLAVTETGAGEDVVFPCGEAYDGCIEMVSLAGTGAMAAINARMVLGKKKVMAGDENPPNSSY